MVAVRRLSLACQASQSRTRIGKCYVTVWWLYPHSNIPRRHVESQGICYFSHGGLPEASILRHPVLVLRAAASSHGGCELEQPVLTQTSACLSSGTFLHPNLLAATSQHGGLSFLVFFCRRARRCTTLACGGRADRHLGTTLGRVAYIHAPSAWPDMVTFFMVPLRSYLSLATSAMVAA